LLTTEYYTDGVLNTGYNTIDLLIKEDQASVLLTKEYLADGLMTAGYNTADLLTK
jgi:hypothetical protein